MSTSDLSNWDFARRMRQLRARAKFTDLPDDILPCATCTGAGVNMGHECGKCEGFGFHKPDGSIAEIHSARGGFYEFGAVDAVFETLCNIKLAHAGLSEANTDNCCSYSGTEGREYYFVVGSDLLALLCDAASQRFATRPVGRDTEAWLLPTPAPARSRIVMREHIDGGPEGDLSVWFKSRDTGGIAEEVLVYHALQHHADMVSSSISKSERIARVIDGQYLVHPESHQERAWLPATTATLKLNPLMTGALVEDVSCDLRRAADVSKLTQLLPRVVAPIAMSMELRATVAGNNVWSYAPCVDLMTL